MHAYWKFSAGIQTVSSSSRHKVGPQYRSRSYNYDIQMIHPYAGNFIDFRTYAQRNGSSSCKETGQVSCSSQVAAPPFETLLTAASSTGNTCDDAFQLSWCSHRLGLSSQTPSPAEGSSCRRLRRSHRTHLQQRSSTPPGQSDTRLPLLQRRWT